MLFWLICLLCASVSCRAVDGVQQRPLVLESGPRNVPGGSLVKLCPESRESDLLLIERIVNEPQTTYLNDEIDVLIWGKMARNISRSSTVDYQINATANNGDSGAYNGTFHICDYLEKMHQPPQSNEREKACPPTKGPIFIDYAMWFADFLLAPGIWDVKFDAKTPEGDRIYCLITEINLQCRPEHDGPECVRDVSEALNHISWLLQR